MDYSLSQALRGTLHGIQRVLLTYDIMCQYGINLESRFRDVPYLQLPHGLDIQKAVGVWHIGDHIADCYAPFFPGFVTGIGVVDGEIVETLWSQLNLLAPTTRTMTHAGRTETLDDGMGDSNWKKTTNMCKL